MKRGYLSKRRDLVVSGYEKKNLIAINDDGTQKEQIERETYQTQL